MCFLKQLFYSCCTTTVSNVLNTHFYIPLGRYTLKHYMFVFRGRNSQIVNSMERNKGLKCLRPASVISLSVPSSDFSLLFIWCCWQCPTISGVYIGVLREDFGSYASYLKEIMISCHVTFTFIHLANTLSPITYDVKCFRNVGVQFGSSKMKIKCLVIIWYEFFKIQHRYTPHNIFWRLFPSTPKSCLHQTALSFPPSVCLHVLCTVLFACQHADRPPQCDENVNETEGDYRFSAFLMAWMDLEHQTKVSLIYTIMSFLSVCLCTKGFSVSVFGVSCNQLYKHVYRCAFKFATLHYTFKKKSKWVISV